MLLKSGSTFRLYTTHRYGWVALYCVHLWFLRLRLKKPKTNKLEPCLDLLLKATWSGQQITQWDLITQTTFVVFFITFWILICCLFYIGSPFWHHPPPLSGLRQWDVQGSVQGHSGHVTRLGVTLVTFWLEGGWLYPLQRIHFTRRTIKINVIVTPEVFTLFRSQRLWKSVLVNFVM